MPVDYSKWDALELSDDSDIEVHPNVDKRSFIRAKQNQIHQQRDERRHEITTLKYERIINDGLLTRIDNLTKALKTHAFSNDSPDELVFQSLIESAGDPAEDQPPPPPDGVHTQVKDRPTFSRMMAALVDDVKKEVEEKKLPDPDRLKGYIDQIGVHHTKVLDLQQQLLKRLAELEKLEGSKITSESYKDGFNTSHVSKSISKSISDAESKKPKKENVELLNPPRRTPASDEDIDSGAEADVEESDAPEDKAVDSPHRANAKGLAFGNIHSSDYRASLNYIQQNPDVLAERNTDGLLLQAFDEQIAGKSEAARGCVHQALLLQYCRALGRDGVALFFKRMTTKDHQARKVFFDDVNDTYARLRTRALEMGKERADELSEDVEQIQLHAVDPDQTITINVPASDDPEQADARKIFESFPPGLQRALETGQLDEVNKVLGKMSVAEAEEVVEKLGDGGMLSLEQGVIDATTEEGQAAMKEIERMKQMPASSNVAEDAISIPAVEQVD